MMLVLSALSVALYLIVAVSGGCCGSIAFAGELPRERIVYTTLRPANWEMFLFEPNAAPKQITDDPALDYDATFSPDGRWIVFCSERSSNPDVYALDLKQSATPTAAQTSALKIHPKVFSMIDCWVSDSESPVVTEINLDAVEKNGNQFNGDDVKPDGEWLRCPVPDTNGFMRYRVLESKGNHYKVEYQENGGGTLTAASIIEFAIEKRDIRRDEKPATIRVLRVLSYNQK
jgi:WD40-like Beta Propeller Repeat